MQYPIVYGMQGAWANPKLFDEPVRAWLKKHWLKRA